MSTKLVIEGARLSMRSSRWENCSKMYTENIRKICAVTGLIIAAVVLFNAGIGFKTSVYRSIVSLGGMALIIIATIYINFYSQSPLKIRVIKYALPFILYCVFLVFLGVAEQEYYKALGWLFSATLIIALMLNKEIGIVFYYFILFVNFLNLLALLMVLLLHVIPNFSDIPFVVYEDSLGFIHYDTNISLFGYSFKRYVGLVSQSSLVPAYVILPAIMYFLFFKEKSRVLPIAVGLLSMVTLSGGYITLVMLTPILYLSNRLFSIKSLVPFVFIMSIALVIVAGNAQHFLSIFDQAGWEYFDKRVWSGAARLEIIIKMVESIDLHVLLLGSSVNDTGLFGNFFLTSVIRSGLGGLFFSIWICFMLSILAKKCCVFHSNRPGFAYFALIAFFVQGFLYYDFGLSNYYGFLIIFILMFFLQAGMKRSI